MALLQLEPSAGRCAPNAALLTRPLQLRSFPPHGNHALLFKASKSAECTAGCNKHSHLTSPFGSAFNKPPYGLGFVVFSHERWLSDKRAQSCLSHAEDLQAPAQLSSPQKRREKPLDVTGLNPHCGDAQPPFWGRPSCSGTSSPSALHWHLCLPLLQNQVFRRVFRGLTQKQY